MSRLPVTHRRRSAAGLLLTAVLPCTPALGQAAGESPEDVAQRFAAALRDTAFVRMASLMHPSALAQLRELFAPVLECDVPEADEIRASLFGARSTAEAARMSDTLLMAAVLRFGTTREEGMTAFIRTAQMQVLGHVAEGRDTVHVLTRMSFVVETIPMSVIEVASFRRYGDSWRAILKADISALAAMLRGICGARG